MIVACALRVAVARDVATLAYQTTHAAASEPSTTATRSPRSRSASVCCAFASSPQTQKRIASIGRVRVRDDDAYERQCSRAPEAALASALVTGGAPCTASTTRARRRPPPRSTRRRCAGRNLIKNHHHPPTRVPARAATHRRGRLGEAARRAPALMDRPRAGSPPDYRVDNPHRLTVARRSAAAQRRACSPHSPVRRARRDVPAARGIGVPRRPHAGRRSSARQRRQKPMASSGRTERRGRRCGRPRVWAEAEGASFLWLACLVVHTHLGFLTACFAVVASFFGCRSVERLNAGVPIL